MLENPTYVEVLLCIISGKNYATAISRILKKKQPTVTEQIKQLERAGLIKPLKRRKAQKYEVDWGLLLDVFYNVVRDVIKLREEFLESEDLKEIERTNLQEIIPKALVEGFLKEYFDTLRELGGKRKGFDEIIFSFFSAMNKLDKFNWKRLVKSFRIDKKILADIANALEFEIYGIEQTALMTYLDLYGRS